MKAVSHKIACRAACEQAARDMPSYVTVGEARPYEYETDSCLWYVEVDVIHTAPRQGAALALYSVSRTQGGVRAVWRSMKAAESHEQATATSRMAQRPPDVLPPQMEHDLLASLPRQTERLIEKLLQVLHPDEGDLPWVCLLTTRLMAQHLAGLYESLTQVLEGSEQIENLLVSMEEGGDTSNQEGEE
jgi:hypothetical protein